MARRKSAGIDRKALYLPRVADWDFRRLGPAEVERRLVAVRETHRRLVEWIDDLEIERRAAKSALWLRLPEAKLYEATIARDHLEDLGKQLKELAKHREQAEAAIVRIERGLGWGAAADPAGGSSLPGTQPGSI